MKPQHARNGVDCWRSSLRACLITTSPSIDPTQPVGGLLRLGKLRQREPMPQYRHWSICLHACACSFLIREFLGPTDGRTCDSRQHNVGYFVGLRARDQKTKGPKSEPRPLSTPHVSLLHPLSRFDVRQPGSKSSCRSAMGVLGLWIFHKTLATGGLELIRRNCAVAIDINHFKVDDVRHGLILRDCCAIR